MEEKRLNIAFKESTTDEAILKSIMSDDLHEYDQDELAKALNKTGLVQVQTTVHGRSGDFTRMQWKKASDVGPNDRVVGGDKDSNSTTDNSVRKVKDADDVSNGIKKINREIGKKFSVYNSVSAGVNLSDSTCYGCEAHIFATKLTGGDVDKAKSTFTDMVKNEFGSSAEIEYKSSPNENEHLIASIKIPKADKKDKRITSSTIKSPNGTEYKFETSKDKYPGDVKVKVTNPETHCSVTVAGVPFNEYNQMTDSEKYKAFVQYKVSLSDDPYITGKKKEQPAASEKKYTRTEKEDNWRRLSKQLLHLADVGTQTTFEDIAPVNGEVEKLYKEGGLFKKDYENLCGKIAYAQRRAKMLAASKPAESKAKLTTDSPKSKEDAKKFVKEALDKNGGDKKKTIADFKAMGITWEEKDHPAINWMRANVAAQKFFTEGKADTPKEDKTQSTPVTPVATDLDKPKMIPVDKTREKKYKPTEKEKEFVADLKDAIEEHQESEQKKGFGSRDHKVCKVGKFEWSPEGDLMFNVQAPCSTATYNGDVSHETITDFMSWFNRRGFSTSLDFKKDGKQSMFPSKYLDASDGPVNPADYEDSCYVCLPERKKVNSKDRNGYIRRTVEEPYMYKVIIKKDPAKK